MQLTITINCDNAVFKGSGCGNEIARILAGVVAIAGHQQPSSIVAFLSDLNLQDANGNTVGRVTVEQ